MDRYRSKSLATWSAVVGGAFGAHRFYLHGARDPWAWLHPAPSLFGLWGLHRVQSLGHNDQLAWLLLPLLGAMLSIGMLAAIVMGLTPDERWDAHYNPGQPGRPTAWLPVLGVIAAVMLGGITLIGTIAYTGQRYFEWRAQPHKVAVAPPLSRKCGFATFLDPRGGRPALAGLGALRTASG